MNINRQILSPIVMFVLLIFSVELFLRLPYVLSVRADPYLNRKAYIGFFSDFNPETVIFTGLMLLTCAFVVLSISVFFNKGIKYSAIDIPIPKIPISISIMALILSGASLYMIAELSGDIAYGDDFDISGKRSFADSPFLYLILRIAMFNHIVIALAYVRAVQTKGVFSWICFIIPTLIFLASLAFISHRALLFIFCFEVLYFQILLRQLNLRRFLTMGIAFVILLLIITVLRTNQQHANLLEAFDAGVRRALESRYFFDFSKLGVGYLWSTEINWLGPLSISFLFEPFFSTDNIYYKDIGRIISRQAYNVHLETGVTTGGYLEAILSFGVVGGGIFLGSIICVFLLYERRLFERQTAFILKIYLVMALSKVVLFLNSSFGAFCFQLVVESLLFMIFIFPFVGRQHRVVPRYKISRV